MKLYKCASVCAFVVFHFQLFVLNHVDIVASASCWSPILNIFRSNKNAINTNLANLIDNYIAKIKANHDPEAIPDDVFKAFVNLVDYCKKKPHSNTERRMK